LDERTTEEKIETPYKTSRTSDRAKKLRELIKESMRSHRGQSETKEGTRLEGFLIAKQKQGLGE
jgi:hypothetical protein